MEFQNLSAEILKVFLGEETTLSPPEFNLPDVVSGKFVQRFFHLLANPE